jgi:hypothetical protein
VALIKALNTQIEELGELVSGHFGHHPDCYRSAPATNAATI